MLTIHLDTDNLSTEELANLSYVLHERCAECLEHHVPSACAHPEQVREFLDTLACLVDESLCVREREANAEALGVDDANGEWLSGA